MKRCLIYLERDHYKNSEELLEAAKQIYEFEAYETYGVSVGTSADAAFGLFDKMIEITNSNLREYDIGSIASVLEELHLKHPFDSILFPATQTGRMLAPRLAMKLNAGLIADITAIRRSNGTLEIVRPAFGGKLMAGIVSTGGPLMMTVRQNVFSYLPESKKRTETMQYHPKHITENQITLLGIREREAGTDIRDSEVLISGGGGVMKDFPKLKLLADEMNAQVASSRKNVDNGIAPRSIQVGQSGKTVSPRLYFALGISGSIQHIEGLKNVETIISVNTNKNAPICSISDIFVEGDALQFIEKLIDKIKHEKNKNE